MRVVAPDGITYELVSPFEMPDIARDIIGDKYIRGAEMNYLRAMGVSDSKRKVDSLTYSWLEEENTINTAFKITASAANATVPTDVDVTVAAENHGANGHSYPIVTNTIQFANGVQGLVIAVDRTGAQDVLTIRGGAGQNVVTAAAADVTNSSSVLAFGNAQKEKSDTPEGRYGGYEEYDGRVQVFRQAFEFTDFAQISKAWGKSPDGKTYYITTSEVIRAAENFELDQLTTFLIGKRMDGSLTDADGNPIYTTQGIIPRIENEGNTFVLDAGGWTLDELTKFINFGITKHANSAYTLAGDFSFVNSATKDFLLDFGQGHETKLELSRIGMSQEQAIELGLKYVNLNGRMIAFQEWTIFNHPNGLGAQPELYAGTGLGLPLGKTKAMVPTNSGNRTEVSTNKIKMVYTDLNMSPQYMKGDYAMWDHGAQGATATSGKMHRVGEFYTIKGVEMHCLNQFFRIKKGA